MEKGEFDPAGEKTFSPSPVNRIDRNTTGLVIFAKNYDALKKLNGLIRSREKIRKFYFTVVCGMISEETTLTGSIEKDEARNVSRMTEPDTSESAKSAVTHVRPVLTGRIRGYRIRSRDSSHWLRSRSRQEGPTRSEYSLPSPVIRSRETRSTEILR